MKARKWPKMTNYRLKIRKALAKNDEPQVKRLIQEYFATFLLGCLQSLVVQTPEEFCKDLKLNEAIDIMNFLDRLGGKDNPLKALNVD